MDCYGRFIELIDVLGVIRNIQIGNRNPMESMLIIDNGRQAKYLGGADRVGRRHCFVLQEYEETRKWRQNMMVDP